MYSRKGVRCETTMKPPLGMRCLLFLNSVSRSRYPAALTLAALALVLCPRPAEADSRWRQGYYDSPGGVNLDSAVGRVRDRTGARILSADTVRRDNGSVHDIKILTPEGRVRRLQVDGRTGDEMPQRR